MKSCLQCISINLSSTQSSANGSHSLTFPAPEVQSQWPTSYTVQFPVLAQTAMCHIHYHLCFSAQFACPLVVPFTEVFPSAALAVPPVVAVVFCLMALLSIQ